MTRVVPSTGHCMRGSSLGDRGPGPPGSCRVTLIRGQVGMAPLPRKASAAFPRLAAAPQGAVLAHRPGTPRYPPMQKLLLGLAASALATPLLADSPASWEAWREEVEAACLALVTDFRGQPVIEV